jgi:hypothetical protein
MLLVSSSAARGPDNWDYRDPGTAPGGEDIGWGVDQFETSITPGASFQATASLVQFVCDMLLSGEIEWQEGTDGHESENLTIADKSEDSALR